MSEEKEYIPINKGHFDMDTPERMEAFKRNLSYGWEEEYKEYRELWNELPKSKTVREYPLLIDIELASLCNLKCPMCFTITDEFKSQVTKGLLDFDLFKKIIDEVKGKVYSVRLSYRGESTLHKNFIECIEYAKNAGIKEVSTLTNGSKFKPKFMASMIDAGIDWVTISVDGVDEEYNRIRKPCTFDGLLENLTFIKEYKERHGLKRPVIKVQGIWPAIRKNPEKYYKVLSPLTDLVAYNPLIDYLRNDSDIVYEDNFSCPQFYQRMFVGSDGRAMMCSNDENCHVPLGDAYKESIYGIWHGERLEGMRKLHAKKDGFKKCDVCRACFYPRKAIPDEQVTVDGRTFWVENYINRAQEVGQ